MHHPHIAELPQGPCWAAGGLAPPEGESLLSPWLVLGSAPAQRGHLSAVVRPPWEWPASEGNRTVRAAQGEAFLLFFGHSERTMSSVPSAVTVGAAVRAGG